MAKRKYRAAEAAGKKASRHGRVDRNRPLWIYGLHPVVAALKNPRRRASRLLATPQALERLVSHLGAMPESPRPEAAGRGDLDHLLPDSVHQGIALQAERLPATDLDDLLEAPDPGPSLLIALDQVTDPQNVGAILRSAAFFGARGVLMTDRHAPPESGALAKAAAGALDLVPLARVGNLAAALRRVKEAGYWCVGLDGDAPDQIGDVAYTGPTALVMGAEGAGLRRLTAETCDQVVALPRPGGDRDVMESLNVSNAAAVAMALLVSRKG